MDNETNQTTLDINVYFVIPSEHENVNECNKDMWDAYNKCPDWDINPQWISEHKCLKMNPDKKDVFVMETFKGEIFEKLQMFKCTIVGPSCLLSCFLMGEPIPEGTTPVFNTAMRGFVVSASGFSAFIKNEIQRKVEYMGGIFTKQLRASVTHLVTNIVMSAKYERAVELNIKIVTNNWIESVWNTNLKEYISANDSRFDEFKCPIFLNLVVTSTNLNKRQKEEIKKLINQNGGEFMGALDGSKIKVVITSETSNLSDKLKYAMQYNIPCLKINWVYDSVEAGYSLPFNTYLIKSTQACSTPEKSGVPESFNCSTISVIPGDNPNLCVNETLTSATMTSTLCTDTIPKASKISYVIVMERLNLAVAKKAGPFLDGCNIYLAGFSTNYRDKLNRILNVGSATRLDEISDALTHVIIGDSVKAMHDLKVIKSKNLFPYILKIEWLEECIKLQAPAPEDNYLFDGKDDTGITAPEPPSPLSKKNLQLLQRPKIPAAPLFDEDKYLKNSVDEHSKIIEQYLHKSTSELPSNNTVERDLTIKTYSNITCKNNKISFNGEGDDSAIPISQDSVITQKLFEGLNFIVVGFDKDDYLQLIAQIHGLGGKVVGNNYSGIPDYGLVPQFGAELRHTVSEIVTELFIEDCIDSEKLVDAAYYHSPILISNSAKPLTNCVIGMSTYNGAERTYLSKLSEALGARYQDTFARKTNLQKNTYSSTHLICPKPQGDKYSAAVKWGLPAVTAEWLLKCASEMKLVDETLYLVGETMAPERDDTTFVVNNELTLIRQPTEFDSKQQALPQEKFKNGNNDTPHINKRVNDLTNDNPQQSPFHISTPETPYGQLFKDNPSPRTRKAWLRWIDHFPDLKTEEPPSKKRRSTPLSDVKRMAWDFVTGRLDRYENNGIEEKENDTDKTNNEKEAGEPGCSHSVTTNRRLSFSDEKSPNKSSKNTSINLQIAQLEEVLVKASNTFESRHSFSENVNPYHLEPKILPGTCLMKESQLDSVGWEDPVKRVPPSRQSVTNRDSVNISNVDILDVGRKNNQGIQKKKPKFMFSGIKDKGIAEKLIRQLGGEISAEPTFDESATHLLCLKPARNEKILSSIAAGKWVLHYLYIEACNDEKKLVNEEEFELGNPKSKGKIPDPCNDNEKMIMDAAYRWRIKLLNDPGGAFRHITALLVTPKEKKEQFQRLIHAGGGTVVETKPPYDSNPHGKKITHCFIQLKQIEHQVDWAMMASKGIMCFPPQFLNDHLMAETPVNPRECVLPEFQKYLALMPPK